MQLELSNSSCIQQILIEEKTGQMIP